jgi:hypothetical protein
MKDYINECTIRDAYHICQLHAKSLPYILLSRLTPYAEEINGDQQCGFLPKRSTTVIYSAFVKDLRKNGEKEAEHQLFIDLKSLRFN